MSNLETIQGKCPKCGEELQIPAKLTTFSCMFCGAKLTQEDLMEELPPINGDANALFASAKEGLQDVVIRFRQNQECISKAAFEPAFAKMEEYCKPFFLDLDTACRINPAHAEDMVRETVLLLLDTLEADWKKVRNVSRVREGDKMVIAIFLVPMVGHLKLSISQDFCQFLHGHWCQRYPKSIFFIGQYEEISKGFQKKFKLCFITTAICQQRNLPDDCEYLTAFRGFRDNYLAKTSQGRDLVEEYYNIAPGILTAIRYCDNQDAKLTAIGHDYLDPCYKAIQENRLSDCQKTYTQMVEDLKAQYFGTM